MKAGWIKGGIRGRESEERGGWGVERSKGLCGKGSEYKQKGGGGGAGGRERKKTDE